MAADVPEGNLSVPQRAKAVNGQTVESMVCGSVGLVLFPTLATIAIWFGVAAKQAIRRNPDRMTGQCQAMASIVMSFIPMVIGAIGVVRVVLGGGMT